MEPHDLLFFSLFLAIKYDIICLDETKVKDLTSINVEGFKYIHLPQSNPNHKYGGTHGIGTLVKNSVHKYISTIIIPDCSCENVQWVKVNKDLLGYDFIIGNVYTPHENSVYYDCNVFDHLSIFVMSY